MGGWILSMCVQFKIMKVSFSSANDYDVKLFYIVEKALFFALLTARQKISPLLPYRLLHPLAMREPLIPLLYPLEILQRATKDASGRRVLACKPQFENSIVLFTPRIFYSLMNQGIRLSFLRIRHNGHQGTNIYIEYG